MQQVHRVELLDDQFALLDGHLGLRVALELQIGLVAQDVHHFHVDLEGLGGEFQLRGQVRLVAHAD
ncbi:hypothetical protein D9M69_451850 [compost metagenome]